MQARGLFDDGVEIAELDDLLGQRRLSSVPDHRRHFRPGGLQHLGMVQQTVHHPGQRGGRGLVPGQQHGNHLVPDFRVAHGLAVFVARGDEHRHDVGPLVFGLGFAPRDLVVQQRVDCAGQRGDPPPGGERPQVDLQPADQQQRAVADQLEKLDQQRAQARQPRSFLHPEHGPQDDVERNVLHPRVQRKRRLDRPVVDRPVGDFTHHGAVQPHPLAVERRHEQLALAFVPGAVEQQHRVGTQDGLEHHVGLPGLQAFRVRGENLFDDRGLAEKRQRRHPGPTHRERTAVRPRACLHERDGLADPFENLQQPRRTRTGWQCGHGGEDRERVGGGQGSGGRLYCSTTPFSPGIILRLVPKPHGRFRWKA